MCGMRGIRFTAGSILGVVIAVTLCGGPWTAIAKKPRPERCADGRFTVAGEALLPGGSTPEAVLLEDSNVSIASGCASHPAKVKVKRSGTRLKVRFASCDGVTGAVKVKARFDASCQVLTGTLRARKAKLTREFTATRASIAAAPNGGSAVAVTPDGSRAVVVNRDVGSVTVIELAYPTDAAPTASVRAELDLGMGSEPWQAAVHPDGGSAYVVLRKEQRLVKIENLADEPSVGATAASVGSEPTGVALTPSGARAWVANWVDGTLTEVDTGTMTVAGTVDLNAALVATGLIGDVTARPALAHPRAIAVTNDGDLDEGDEKIYATEFYAQRTTPEAGDGANADGAFRGLVYVISLASRNVFTVPLDPLADMGFRDQNDAVTGCFPNQLHGITLNGPFAYVLSVCASPRGPIGPRVTATACTTADDCAGLVDPACVAPAAGLAPVCVDKASTKTTTAPLVSVIDTRTDTEVAEARASLNAAFVAEYDTRGTPDNAARRLPLFATDMAFVPGTAVGYATANGADAVFRLVFDGATGELSSVGATNAAFLDLAPTGIAADAAGRGPIGIAITGGGVVALVTNDVTRNATLLDLRTQAIAGGVGSPSVVGTAALPEPGSREDDVLRGKRFFNTGLARWSLGGQGWGACQSCHPDGLTDNVTWYFARGPRQATSLDGSFATGDPDDQRVFNWTAIFDEVDDFELNTRGVSGGVGAIVSALSSPAATSDRIDLAAPEGDTALNGAGLNGSSAKLADPTNPLGLAEAGKLEDWAEITAFMEEIRSPRAPTTLDTAKVDAGRTLFTTEGGCQGCHGGAKWTTSRVFYDPTPATTAALRTTSWEAAVTTAGFPAALLPAATPANRVMRLGNAANDQILCAVRPVGTFGVAEEDVGVAELRSDMTTAAQGNGDGAGDGKGYNPPSLLALPIGGPFLHAGNARTLESLFSDTFVAHHRALAPNFLIEVDPSAKVEQLVQFLLSIDETTATVTIPPLGPQGGDFCALP
jgi:DNA-binding beta-propeller fold protein YncE